MRTTIGWQSADSTTPGRAPIERRELRDDDMVARVEYCGVCHDIEVLPSARVEDGQEGGHA